MATMRLIPTVCRIPLNGVIALRPKIRFASSGNVIEQLWDSAPPTNPTDPDGANNAGAGAPVVSHVGKATYDWRNISRDILSVAKHEKTDIVRTLYDKSDAVAGLILEDHTLASEQTPDESRRVLTEQSLLNEDHKDSLAAFISKDPKKGRVYPESETDAAQIVSEHEQDGLMNIVLQRGRDIQIFSGFVVGESHADTYNLVTCLHSLYAIMDSRFDYTNEEVPSTAYALSSSGHVFPIVDVIASRPSSDLLLLSIKKTPLGYLEKVPNDQGEDVLFAADSSSAPHIKSLPLSPFPLHEGKELATAQYRIPGQATRFKHSIVENYRDSIGRIARVGTYDELWSMEFAGHPAPGDSGSPVIDPENGAVVGIVRGFTASYKRLKSSGLGTPAERIFEMFPLPGFVPSSRKYSS